MVLTDRSAKRPLLEQLTDRGDDRIALPVATAAADLAVVLIRRSWR